MTLSKPQRRALYRVYNRRDRSTATMSYREFRRTAQQGYDCIMVPWAGMWLGIENDGYTHS